MKLNIASTLLAFSSLQLAESFTTHQSIHSISKNAGIFSLQKPSFLSSERKESRNFMSKNDENYLMNDIMKGAKGAISTGMMAALLWASPIAMVNMNENNMIMDNSIRSSLVADAKELASGSGSRVNKDAESLLRYGLPINNKEVSTCLMSIITISFYS